MENPQVVIKYISYGEKRYVGDLQQGSYSGYLSKRPFADPNVQKFDLATALKIVEKSPLKSAFTHYQILDDTGKVYYDNVNKIMREEIQKFLNEGFLGEAEPANTDSLKFTEPINATFINYEAFSNDYDAKVLPAKIIVHWNPIFKTNPMGIHNFDINVTGVEGVFVLNLHDKQSDELMQQTQKDIKEIPWHFRVEEAVLQLGSSLYITELEFDFKNNLCTVIF
jgi:hypothetical protein